MADLPERLAPFPSCSATTRLSYDGHMLILATGMTAKTYPAASGKLGSDFSVRAQRDQNKGVIPAGSYWIDPEQMWTAGSLRDFLAQLPLTERYYGGWGNHRITIHIMPDTETYGRGGFFIHGGAHMGSAGCIHVVNDDMERFVADLKEALGGSPKCSVQLTVAYP